MPAPPDELSPILVVNEEDFDAVPSPARVNVARAVIALTALITLVAIAAIFYRSVTVTEPTSAVLVIADETFDGAEIVVVHDKYPPEYPSATATLSAENNFQTHILIRPGDYVIDVTLKGQPVIKQERFHVEPYRGAKFLRGKPAAAEAAAEAAAAQSKPAPGESR